MTYRHQNGWDGSRAYDYEIWDVTKFKKVTLSGTFGSLCTVYLDGAAHNIASNNTFDLSNVTEFKLLAQVNGADYNKDITIMFEP